MARHKNSQPRYNVRRVNCKDTHNVNDTHDTKRSKHTRHNDNNRQRSTHTQDNNKHNHIEYVDGTNSPKLSISDELRERTNRYTQYKERYNAQRRKLWWTPEQYAHAKCKTYGSKTEGKRYATTRTMWHIKMETTGQLYPNTIEIPTSQQTFKDEHTEYGIAFVYTPHTNTIAILKGEITHNGDDITMKVKIGRRKAIMRATLAREFYNTDTAPHDVKYKGQIVPTEMLLKATMLYHTHVYRFETAHTNSKRMTQDELWRYKVATGQVKPYEPEETHEETEQEKMEKLNEAYNKMKGDTNAE